jgi:hypothetical protein
MLSVIKTGSKVTVAEVKFNLKDLKKRIIKGGHGFASRDRGGGGGGMGLSRICLSCPIAWWKDIRMSGSGSGERPP